MRKILQHIFSKKSFLKEDKEGFSLIELVVVVSVLSVLAAIALPTFTCITRKAKATSALAALRQITTECNLIRVEGSSKGFKVSPLDGYTIQTSGSNSCDGTNGVISTIPDDANELPTFNMETATGLLTYTFRGETGTDFSACLGLICGSGDSGNSSNDISFARVGEVDSFECKYVDLGDSNYERDQAKYLHSLCEEFRQGQSICSSSSSNVPGSYELRPCASMCDENIGNPEFQSNWCSENSTNGNSVPEWIESPDATTAELLLEYFDQQTQNNNVQCSSANGLPSCTGEEMLKYLIDEGHLFLK
tara:strand:+ start:1196 stop:2113 length:918 start_codon:yes stop_codon:yes gene_type:complete